MSKVLAAARPATLLGREDHLAVLAVLKAGAGYVPVDLAYPSDRISYMLAEACPVAVLTTMVAGRDLPDGVPRVALGDPATAAAERVQGSDSACAPRFTSDDTGRPFGRPVSWAGFS
jgi:non-ribosomal peptide synthetase component F